MRYGELGLFYIVSDIKYRTITYWIKLNMARSCSTSFGKL